MVDEDGIGAQGGARLGDAVDDGGQEFVAAAGQQELEPVGAAAREVGRRLIGMKPMRSMAEVTASTVALRTPGRPFSTRSTVARLTPASLARSLVVGGMARSGFRRSERLSSPAGGRNATASEVRTSESSCVEVRTSIPIGSSSESRRGGLGQPWEDV